MSITTLKAEDLEHFTGSENWYQHGSVRTITYTDGAKHVAVPEAGLYSSALFRYMQDPADRHDTPPAISTEPLSSSVALC